MIVKICGITRVEDADVAVEHGAAALGFIFWPGSARCVQVEQARAIVASLRAFVTPVGVFVDQAIDDVNATAEYVRLGAVQLHGSESPADAARCNRPVIKAVPWTEDIGSAALDQWPAHVTLLLDAADPIRRGGTGRTIDWTTAERVARQRPIVLAGGLTPGNVADAIARVRPLGIDVSSGVERAPGVKDPRLIRELFDAVASCSTLTESGAGHEVR